VSLSTAVTGCRLYGTHHPPTLTYLLTMADDTEMFAMMGMPMAFGKQAKKRTVDVAARYETTKRAEPEPVNVSDSVCNVGGENSCTL
jgi:hypothetical protein